MEKVDKVTIRLTGEQASALDSLVLEGGYKNRSHALRASLDRMVQGDAEEPGLTKIHLDDWVVSSIKGLVAIGMYDSFDSAVRRFLRDHLREIKVDQMQAEIDWMKEWGDRTSSTKSIVESAYEDYVKK
jgi:Arc/MetJ-type ribon-helix-helix transcriptional regulator